MHSKNFILQKLSPFKNYKKVITTDQTTKDIVNGIVNTHYNWDNEYDKISKYFLGQNVEETAKNVWEFLKNNVPYYIESSANQTLRSPAAIVSMPGDCKSYALFVNGIFSSLCRKGLMCVPVAYRFASYKDNVKEPGHVFAVLYPGTNKEIWVDPVLDRFDDRSKQPTFFKDKKVKMSLIALSGVQDYTAEKRFQEMSAYRDKLVSDRDRLLNNGKIKSGSSKELEYKVAINKVTRALQDMPSISGFADILKNVTNAGSKASDLANPVKLGIDAISNLLSLIQSKGGTPNDWRGWEVQARQRGIPIGTAAHFISKHDGDSVSNEAINLISWIKNYGIDTVLGYNTWNKETVTIEDIADKVRRGGYPQEAEQFLNEYKGVKSKNIDPNAPTSQKAGMNIALTLGLVAGAFLLVKSFAKK